VYKFTLGVDFEIFFVGGVEKSLVFPYIVDTNVAAGGNHAT
jgi:hypothetical protein